MWYIMAKGTVLWWLVWCYDDLTHAVDLADRYNRTPDMSVRYFVISEDEWLTLWRKPST